jgi:hypothetical protein
MIYLKGLSKIAFVIVLMALGNSLIVQPAMEIQKKHMACHEQENNGDESQCCFICYPVRWIANASTPEIRHTVSSTFVQYHSFTAYSDPRIESIFRPPLAI